MKTGTRQTSPAQEDEFILVNCGEICVEYYDGVWQPL